MQLLIINGSPRGTKSNSKIFLDYFTKGVISSILFQSVEVCYLNKIKSHKQFIEQFKASSHIVIAFPLYTDSMPGIVMNFIELLPHCPNKTVGFIIQSGFPEAEQSMYVERYLEKLAKRMEWNYAGTIIKGGVEAMSIFPKFSKLGMYKNLFRIGQDFGKTGLFNAKIVARMKNPFKHKKIELAASNFMISFGLVAFYWNLHLAKNKAIRKRSDTPYA